MDRKIIVGITQGDTNGVGYEVIIKSLTDARLLDLCVPVVYGSSRAFGFYKKQLPDVEGLNTNIISTAKDYHPKRVNIINCVPDNFRIDPGQPAPEGANAALIALREAVKDLKNGDLDAMVTAPLNKKAVALHFPGFTGHTEFLINEFGANDGLMFLIAEKMRVGVVTNHIPLSKVPSALSVEKILSKLRLMNNSLKEDFGFIRPRIAVLGLNPHSGDSGLLGSEDARDSNPLSEREREVLALLVKGRTAKQIADTLAISKNTVDTHRRRIMDKLGCDSMAELTRYAIREGFLTLD